MKASKLSVLSALVASLCCIGPLLLIFLGLGSLGIGAALSKYHWYFIAGAFVMIFFAWRSYFKKKETCNLKGCQMENKRITLTTLVISTAIVALFAGLNIYTYAIQRDFSEKRNAASAVETETIVIPVKGMTCFTCEITVSSAIKKVEGVIDVTASAKEGKAQVVYNPTKVNINQIVEAVSKTGYRAELPK